MKRLEDIIYFSNYGTQVNSKKLMKKCINLRKKKEMKFYFILGHLGVTIDKKEFN
jgi:hypothetical protein